MRDPHPRNPLYAQIGAREMFRFWLIKRRTERMVRAKQRAGEWGKPAPRRAV